MGLEGSVALVTGGSGGLGSCICTLLATEGADVAIAYLSGKERAEKVRNKISLMGRRAITVQIDQTEPNSIEAGVGQVVSEFGQLDILVNNAAIAMGGHSIKPGTSTRSRLKSGTR